MYSIKRALSILLVVLPLTATAQCEISWQPRLLAETRSPFVELQHNERTVITIPTSWFMALSHINKKINATSGVDARFLLCDSEQPNAMAWSDGGEHFIALTLGMYRLLGDDWHAYAAILGHENAHLAKRHGNKRRNREVVSILAQKLGQSLATESLGDASGLATEGIRITAQAVTSNYSRDEEHEADKYGMRYAYAAGFDPRGALAFHEKMKTASHFLSSHPSSKDRIQKLEKELRKRGW